MIDWRKYQDKATETYSDEDNHIILECAGIDCPEQIVVELPKGWTGHYELSGAFYCSRESCQHQQNWFDKQCPGCVVSYPDCGLGEAFQDRSSLGLTEDQESIIKQGKCPFRHGGTFFVSNTSDDFKLESLDLSEQAEDIEGVAIVEAIRSYHERYNKEEDKRFWWPWKIVFNRHKEFVSAELLQDKDIPEEFGEFEGPRIIQRTRFDDYVIFVWSIRKHFAARDAEIFLEQHVD